MLNNEFDYSKRDFCMNAKRSITDGERNIIDKQKDLPKKRFYFNRLQRTNILMSHFAIVRIV